MFIGSFYRLKTYNDIERGVPMSSSNAIVYVEDERKFYEKGLYGLVREYDIRPVAPDPITCKCIDHTDEITDMEERIYQLEKSIKKMLSKEGRIDEI